MKNVPFSIKRATLDDFEEIMGLLYPRYFEETVYKDLTYSDENTRRMLLSWITQDFSIIAKSKGEVVGFAAMSCMRTFYEEMECDNDMFFVLPEYRATGISRALADTLTRQADAMGAKVIYTACLSGISDRNNGMYVNLWKKFGFKKLGTCLVRS